MKFKVGDRVRAKRNAPYYVTTNGWEGTVKSVDNNHFQADHFNHLEYEHFELISSTNKSTMNIKEKFALAFKQEPEKSFRKAGITNGDDLLTEDGRQIFESWLLKKHGDEFKKEVVDDLLKDEEKAA